MLLEIVLNKYFDDAYGMHLHLMGNAPFYAILVIHLVQCVCVFNFFNFFSFISNFP